MWFTICAPSALALKLDNNVDDLIRHVVDAEVNMSKELWIHIAKQL